MARSKADRIRILKYVAMIRTSRFPRPIPDPKSHVEDVDEFLHSAEAEALRDIVRGGIDAGGYQVARARGINTKPSRF